MPRGQGSTGRNVSATSLSQGRNRSDYKPLTARQRKIINTAVSAIPAGRAVKVGAKVGSTVARSRVGQRVKKFIDDSPKTWEEYDKPYVPKPKKPKK